MNADAITLTFSPQQLDYVANVLAARPYSEVQALLADIGRQVAQQNSTRGQPIDPANIAKAGDSQPLVQ
jgi:hypothetical protein